jgi:hypothetical protein
VEFVVVLVVLYYQLSIYLSIYVIYRLYGSQLVLILDKLLQVQELRVGST